MYEYCTGGNTGYTMSAGRCLVSSAKKDGLTLICVTLNDRNDWQDHIDLYNYGFERYACYQSDDSNFCVDIPCVGGVEDKTTVVGEKDISIVLSTEDKSKVERKIYIDSFLYAPIEKNSKVGKIEYSIDGKVISSVNLLSSEEVNIKKKSNNIFSKIKELFTDG